MTSKKYVNFNFHGISVYSRYTNRLAYLRVDELGVPFAVDGDNDREVGDEYGDREQRDECALRDAGHGQAERQPVGVQARVPAATVVQ